MMRGAVTDQAWRAAAALFASAALNGCIHTVSPPLGVDPPPAITVTGLALSGGSTPQESATMDTKMRVAPGVAITVLASARNAGGVESLSVSIDSDTGPVVSAMTTASPDASGLVPDALFLVGTDGVGGAGTEPMTFSLPAFGVVRVVASARNFIGSTSTVTVTYVTDCECMPNYTGDGLCNCDCPLAQQCGSPFQPGSTQTPCCGQTQKCCNGQCIDLLLDCCSTACNPGDHCCDAAHNGGCCPIGSICTPELCVPEGFGSLSLHPGPSDASRLPVPKHPAARVPWKRARAAGRS